MSETRSGPLTDFRIVELAGIGPGPFCGMVLSDLGADVVRVDRATQAGRPTFSTYALGRGRRSIAVDLKNPDGVETVLQLVEQADGLIEGYRPGVTERLGVGPDVCLKRNPKLVYGRMTGWGQTGPWAQMAGHDINYIALSGALGAIGREGEPPVPPLNLVGDFGGGGMLLAVGVLAALLEAQRSGEGQVVDAAMVDGAALLTTMFYEMLSHGSMNRERGTNTLDGGAPFYGVYETKDGQYISLGSLEPQFFAEMVERLELDFDLSKQNDTSTYPDLRRQITERVRQRTRAEWDAALAGSDVCFGPVLHPAEAPDHVHNVERAAFVDVDGVRQPAPAPRFSRTPGRVTRAGALGGAHTDEVLADWGFDAAAIAKLRDSGAVA